VTETESVEVPKQWYRTVLATIATVALVVTAAAGGVLAYESHRQTTEEHRQTKCAESEAMSNKIMAFLDTEDANHGRLSDDYRQSVRKVLIRLQRECST
jgi:hypothetical protein